MWAEFSDKFFLKSSHGLFVSFIGFPNTAGDWVVYRHVEQGGLDFYEVYINNKCWHKINFFEMRVLAQNISVAWSDLKSQDEPLKLLRQELVRRI